MGEADLKRNEKDWQRFKDNNYSLDNINSENRKFIIDFLKDFALGINTPKKKQGPRKPGTLLRLRYFLVSLDRQIPNKSFSNLTKRDLHSLCKGMYEGNVKTPTNQKYKDIGTVVKNLKTFFRWMKKTSNIKKNIIEDLSASSYKTGKPAWTYRTHPQIRKLIDSANPTYQTPMLFIYDSGLRPEEAIRIKVSDFTFYEEGPATLKVLEFRENGDRVSKTFERTIKLMNCSNQVKAYIKINGLKPNDLFIQRSSLMFNRYLKRLAGKLFGPETETEARGKINDIDMYAIRHWSAIYWLDRYKTNKDLMYRMGWKNEDKIFYYSEFLGRRDKIDDEDMLTVEDKNRYEKDIEKLKTQENKNLELLSKLSSITQILLKSAMQNENTKESLKKQLMDIFPEGNAINHLQVISPLH